MRKSLIVLPLLFAAVACGQKSEDSAQSSGQTEIVSEEAGSMAKTEAAATSDAAASAPDIDSDVAPGVAFDLTYQFGLAAEKIGDVQEDHARACRKLGIARCRVTGMDYQANGDDVRARLAFKLAPDIASDFTRDARAIVEQAEGKLHSAQVNGKDLGNDIAVSDANVADLKEELAEIERQLAIPNLSRDVRSRLVERMTDIRAQLRAAKSDRRGNQTAVAMTPVVFDYRATNGFLGFDGDSPLSSALQAASTSFASMLQLVLMLIGVIAPWALLIAAGWWASRKLFGSRKAATASEQASD